jgi:hypothetical protein
LVYKEFDRSRHITEKFPEAFSDTILGADFGYTNPSAIIPIKVDSDNHYWIREEFYKTHQTTEQIGEQGLLYKATKHYPDPAEPDRIEILRKMGWNCREVSRQTMFFRSSMTTFKVISVLLPQSPMTIIITAEFNIYLHHPDSTEAWQFLAVVDL